MRGESLIALLIALSIISCHVAAHGGVKYMFGLQLADTFSHEKMKRRIEGVIVKGPEDLAEDLAQTENKDLAIYKSLSVKQLLEAAEMIDVKHCHAERFRSIEYLCKKLSDSESLSKYCQFCIQKRKKACIQFGPDELLTVCMYKATDHEKLKERVRDIDKHISKYGEDFWPLVDNIKGYLARVQGDRVGDVATLVDDCRRLARVVEENLGFFFAGKEKENIRDTMNKAKELKYCKTINDILATTKGTDLERKLRISEK